MQLYDEFNDKFSEINEYLGDVYTYKDLEDLKQAEKDKERKLLREAIKNLSDLYNKEKNKCLEERYSDDKIRETIIKRYREVIEKDYISKDQIRHHVILMKKSIDEEDYSDNTNLINCCIRDTNIVIDYIENYLLKENNDENI